MELVNLFCFRAKMISKALSCTRDFGKTGKKTAMAYTFMGLIPQSIMKDIGRMT